MEDGGQAGGADTLDDDAVAELAGVIDDHGFLSWLDIRVDDVERGRVVFTAVTARKPTTLAVGGSAYAPWGNPPTIAWWILQLWGRIYK